VGLLPVTGQPLPLVSMGGSSIFFTSMATGMILSVSWGTREPEEQAPERQEAADHAGEDRSSRGPGIVETDREPAFTGSDTEFVINGDEETI